MDTTKKTIILFSGDFDRVMAAFIIANGAAAMGDDVTMFFTFWGLNILRRTEHVASTAKKSVLQSMFGRMMHKGTAHLGLSKMNFAGMGAPMMKKAMKQANAMSLDELVQTAREQGVKFVACTLSMDILGFKEEELIDGLEFAGVAAYLGEADEANVNMFI